MFTHPRWTTASQLPTIPPMYERIKSILANAKLTHPEFIADVRSTTPYSCVVITPTLMDASFMRSILHGHNIPATMLRGHFTPAYYLTITYN